MESTQNPLSEAERLDLVLSRLPHEHVSDLQAIRDALARRERNPSVLWVTSPTGKPHIGYLVPLLKLADFVEAGVKVKIVVLDTYSFLDNVDFPMEQVAYRAQYYRLTLTAALECLGVDAAEMEFIMESSYQSPQFIRDLWQLCAITPAQEVKDSWDRAVHPEMVSPLLCPLLQLLAEEYLDVDFQLGGQDQASIFALSKKYAPRLGHRPRGRLTNPMLPSLPGKKMSASNPESTKILLADSDDTILSKLSGTTWQNEVARNIFISSVRDILIPLSEYHARPTAKAIPGWKNPSVAPDAPSGTVFSAYTEDGAVLNFGSFAEVQKVLKDGTLAPDDLKQSVAKCFVHLLSPMQGKKSSSTEFMMAEEKGYPVVK